MTRPVHFLSETEHDSKPVAEIAHLEVRIDAEVHLVESVIVAIQVRRFASVAADGFDDVRRGVRPIISWNDVLVAENFLQGRGKA